MLKKYILFGVVAIFLQSCGSYFNQPFNIEEARIGEISESTEELRSLPKPTEPVVVGVYKFRDQTGQYKPSATTSTFSTAVTQGATSILLKALEDSKWFVPIERENFSNLLNERNVIRTTRKEYRKSKNPNEPQLPPLLYAGILLEGGIVSYDSNIITGGMGARYFGLGASTQYRQDRITVYLRAVSTSSGKILKTVYVSKTILSQALDANFFRYVKLKRLLEAEAGFTKNEPVQLAVTDAIEKAVSTLVLEGIKSGIWKTEDENVDINALIAKYDENKQEAEDTKLYNRYLTKRRSKNAFSIGLGTAIIDGDFANPEAEFMGRVEYKRFFKPYFNLNASYTKFNLANKNALNEGFMSFDLNGEFILLPHDKLTPFVYGGAGLHSANYFESRALKLQLGGGLEYLLNKKMGIKLFAEDNFTFSDELDGQVSGKRDDFYWRIGLGLNIYF